MTCPHGMPKPTNCLTCMEDGPVVDLRPAPWTRVGTPFQSRFAGVCHGCPERVEVGEMIQRYDGRDNTVYVHADGCTP